MIKDKKSVRVKKEKADLSEFYLVSSHLTAVAALPASALLRRHTVVLGVAIVVGFFPVAALVAGHFVVALETIVLTTVEAVIGAAVIPVVAVLGFPANPLPVGHPVVFSVAVVEIAVARALGKTGAVVVGKRRGKGASGREQYGGERSEESIFHRKEHCEALNKQVVG
jgi:hypothetical protein